jgi:hypothetical protein
VESVELLITPLLRAPHGFSTRAGGVSGGAFATLNSSFAVGDSPALVTANLSRLAQAAGVPLERLVTATQVHGSLAVRASPGLVVEADALWTDEPGVSVGVRTADCVPVLIEDAASRRVAAVHAGWRGVLAGVTSRAVDALVAAGSARDDLRAAIGPCIQRCCYEVDGDLPARFARAHGEAVVVMQGRRRAHLDLPLALVGELARAGVSGARVTVLPHCTHCDQRFFSHRRDRGVTGRHLSFITCQAAAAL